MRFNELRPDESFLYYEFKPHAFDVRQSYVLSTAEQKKRFIAVERNRFRLNWRITIFTHVSYETTHVYRITGHGNYTRSSGYRAATDRAGFLEDAEIGSGGTEDVQERAERSGNRHGNSSRVGRSRDETGGKVRSEEGQEDESRPAGN